MSAVINYVANQSDYLEWKYRQLPGLVASLSRSDVTGAHASMGARVFLVWKKKCNTSVCGTMRAELLRICMRVGDGCVCPCACLYMCVCVWSYVIRLCSWKWMYVCLYICVWVCVYKCFEQSLVLPSLYSSVFVFVLVNICVYICVCEREREWEKDRGRDFMTKRVRRSRHLRTAQCTCTWLCTTFCTHAWEQFHRSFALSKKTQCCGRWHQADKWRTCMSISFNCP